MNEIEFDKKIKLKLSKEKTVPYEFTNTILHTINTCSKYRQNEFKSKFNRTIKTSVATFIFVSSLVLATTGLIVNFGLKNMNFGNKQVESAINNGYIQSNDSNDYIYNNEVKYKFDNVFFNDNLMLISLDFEFKDKIDEFNGLSFTGLEIIDENQNQIYFDSENQDIWTKNIASSFNMFVNNKKDKIINETLILTSPKFNNISNINIKFDSLVLYVVENGIPKTKEINDTNDINIKLDVKFNNREKILYTINDININKNINLTNAVYSNSGLGITFKINDLSEGPKYNFELQDKEGNIIYSKTNIISNFQNKELFAWIDVDDNFKDLNEFKVIISNESISNTYILYR